MMEDPRNKIEKPLISIEIASLERWQELKDLKLESLKGPHAEMFGVNPENRHERIEKEEAKGQKEWQERLTGDNAFGVLALRGSDVVGMGLAKKREEKGDWYMYSGYVKKNPEENFQGFGIGKKMFARRLDGIRIRGGVKVTMGVKHKNDTSIHIAELFGFKKLEEGSDEVGCYMQLQNVNDPEVIRKVNEVLNAG